MEVARKLYRERIAPALTALAARVGDAFEEWAFRTSLAFDVLAGRTPQQTHKRPWVRSVEAPVLVDVFDWTTDRLIFSVLVWPSLESSGHDAFRVRQGRVENVTAAIAKGAKEKMWSTYWEVDHGLVWNHARECWVDGDGHRYDGSRFGIGSRRPHAA